MLYIGIIVWFIGFILLFQSLKKMFNNMTSMRGPSAKDKAATFTEEMVKSVDFKSSLGWMLNFAALFLLAGVILIIWSFFK